MIHIIPRMKFTIQTGKSPEEVRALLRSITDTQNKWLNVPGDKAFIGKVGETDFKFLPRLGEVLFAGVVMHVKDSFLPVIIGQIRGQENGPTVLPFAFFMACVCLFMCMVRYNGDGFSGRSARRNLGSAGWLGDYGVGSRVYPCRAATCERRFLHSGEECKTEIGRSAGRRSGR